MTETGKVLQVHFKATQSAEDLYYCPETKRVYVRQPSNVSDKVFWHTSSKWSGGYEADCPIKEGITMQVIDASSNVLFEETLEKDEWNGNTSAVKTGEFKCEAVNRICLKYAQKHSLTPYDQWKAWLLENIEKYQYKDYKDNWLYREITQIDNVEVADVEIIGVPYTFVKTRFKHKISGKIWEEITLVDAKKEICEGICGYKIL